MPTVQLEYDEENAFMLQISIAYRKRQANKQLAFNADELYTRLMQELDNAKIFVHLDSAAKPLLSHGAKAAVAAPK